MKPANPAKSTKSSSSNWLAIGIISLLAGGVLAAKTVFLVDNELEIKTKFAGKSWQLNSQSVRQSANDFSKTTTQYLHPMGEQLRHQSTKLITPASNALTSRKNWCVSTSKLSTILAQAKSLNPLAEPLLGRIDSNSTPPDRVDRRVKSNSKVSKVAKTDRKSNPTVPAPRQWCVKNLS